jgi:hypothetical protein
MSAKVSWVSGKLISFQNVSSRASKTTNRASTPFSQEGAVEALVFEYVVGGKKTPIRGIGIFPVIRRECRLCSGRKLRELIVGAVEQAILIFRDECYGIFSWRFDDVRDTVSEIDCELRVSIKMVSELPEVAFQASKGVLLQQEGPGFVLTRDRGLKLKMKSK